MSSGKVPHAELVDGIWPSTGTYINVRIPDEWLSDDAPNEDLVGHLLCFGLIELIEDRLDAGVEDLCIPTKEIAERSISVLLRYAKELEQFVDGSYDAQHPAQCLPANPPE